MSFKATLCRISVVLAGLLLSACAVHVPLQRAQVDQFKAGDSATQINEKLGKSTPTLEHPFEHEGVVYQAKHFNLQTGTQESGTVVCTPMCLYIPIYVPIYTAFVVVYSADASSVRAFGTLEELSKSEDRTISEFMPALKRSMEVAQANKKKG